MQKTIKLLRYYCNNGEYATTKDGKILGATVGALIDTDKTTYPPICYSLERPLFFNGKANGVDNSKTEINESSCIIAGIYHVVWTYSPRFKREMYLLINVDKRAGIRIHSANDINDLHGCIGLGTFIVSNAKGSDGLFYDNIIADSKNAVKKFENYLQRKPFKLIIEDIDQKSNYNLIKKHNVNFV